MPRKGSHRVKSPLISITFSNSFSKQSYWRDINGWIWLSGGQSLSSVRRLIILYHMGLDTNKHTNFRKLRRKYISKDCILNLKSKLGTYEYNYQNCMRWGLNTALKDCKRRKSLPAGDWPLLIHVLQWTPSNMTLINYIAYNTILLYQNFVKCHTYN